MAIKRQYSKMAAKQRNMISVKADTFEKLQALEISVAGVQLETMDQKVGHLMWFFEHYKNNNSK
ncbi:MAG TPA: hypothetical protein PK765_01550 [bacterium]|nr:hypothetical protein [bacterium]